MDVVHRDRVVSGLTFLFGLALFEISYCVVADVLTFIGHEPTALFFVCASVVDAVLLATGLALIAAGTRSAAAFITLALVGVALDVLVAAVWHDSEHPFINRALLSFIDGTSALPDTMFLAACLWVAASFARKEFWWSVPLALFALSLRAFSSEMQQMRLMWGLIDLETYRDTTLLMLARVTTYGTSLAFLILWWLARTAQLKNGSSSSSS